MSKMRWAVLIGLYALLMKSIWNFNHGDVLTAFYTMLFIGVIALLDLSFKPKE